MVEPQPLTKEKIKMFIHRKNLKDFVNEPFVRTENVKSAVEWLLKEIDKELANEIA